MNKMDKDELLERGRDCLSVLRRIFDDAVQARRFDEAGIWVHEYAGAAKMLHALDMISSEDYKTWTKGVHDRYKRAKYPSAYPEEDT